MLCVTCTCFLSTHNCCPRGASAHRNGDTAAVLVVACRLHHTLHQCVFLSCTLHEDNRCVKRTCVLAMQRCCPRGASAYRSVYTAALLVAACRVFSTQHQCVSLFVMLARDGGSAHLSFARSMSPSRHDFTTLAIAATCICLLRGTCRLHDSHIQSGAYHHTVYIAKTHGTLPSGFATYAFVNTRIRLPLHDSDCRSASCLSLSLSLRLARCSLSFTHSRHTLRPAWITYNKCLVASRMRMPPYALERRSVNVTALYSLQIFGDTFVFAATQSGMYL